MFKKYFMLKCSALLLLLAISFAGFSQYTGYKPVSDIDHFKKHFTVEAGKIQTIKSNFVQEKTLAMLSEKMNSEGKFYFKRSNNVRIEYEKPIQYLLVMNSEKIFMKDGENQSTVNVKSSRLFQQVNRIMIDCVQGSILTSKDFTVRVFENEKSWLMEMTPVAQDLKGFFSDIVIFVDRKDYSVSSIEMHEASGDETKIRFTQKELNVEIADEMFAIH